jgi:phosphate-selective porin OprO and OprP
LLPRLHKIIFSGALTLLPVFAGQVLGQTISPLPELMSVASLYEKIEIPEAEKGDVITPVKPLPAEKKGINTGVNFNIGKTSYFFSFGARIQTRFDYLDYQGSQVDPSKKLFVRRLRFKSDGFLFTPDLGYKFEMDLLTMKVLDLVFQWKLGRNFSFWAGQTKLPGNRERVISSQNLQLVDRSLLNSKFTLDRDIGIWLHHNRKYGNVVLKEMFAVTKGEGINLIYKDRESLWTGLDYTFRFEILPFGEFSGKGDYSGADLAREQTPKLSLGFTFDFNDHAVKSNGQIGKVLDQHGNLRSYFVDAMFKYNGFSVLTEYVNRNTTQVFYENQNDTGEFVNEFYIGNAFNSQAGYLFRNNFEIATRFTYVDPLDFTGYSDMKEYTLGLSKYIIGHQIKIQSDISLIQEEHKENTLRCRLQLELGI